MTVGGQDNLDVLREVGSTGLDGERGEGRGGCAELADLLEAVRGQVGNLVAVDARDSVSLARVVNADVQEGRRGVGEERSKSDEIGDQDIDGVCRENVCQPGEQRRQGRSRKTHGCRERPRQARRVRL